MPRIKRLEIKGFRAFGSQAQVLEFRGPMAVVWGPNSQGKASVAEAIEFLLTGKTVRRELVASAKREFAEALRNAHLPESEEVRVSAEPEPRGHWLNSNAAELGWKYQGGKMRWSRWALSSPPLAACGHQEQEIPIDGPKGNRTPVPTLKEWCPSR